MSVLIFLIVSYILLSISLYLLFRKTEVDPIKGLIPGINFIEWCKLIGRKPIYALWLLFPIVNIFIFCGMAVDLVRSFKKYDFLSSALAVIYAPAKFMLMAYNKDIHYNAPTLPLEKEYAALLHQAKEKNDVLAYNKLLKESPYQKSGPREWTESIVFAVFAAAFIRMFLIEAYVIPTPSMEGSLLVGDFLFVSKAHYGIRTPMTIAMVPLLHNVIPGTNKESYLQKPQLPYYRLPAIEKIDRLEPIVFNWPVGDSIFLTRSRSYSYSMVENFSKTGWPGDLELRQKWQDQDFRVRPIDKKDHYIKRCTAISGDTLQIINGQIYINGEKEDNPSQMQVQTMIILPNGVTSDDVKKLNAFSRNYKIMGDNGELMIAHLTMSEIEDVKALNSEIIAFPYLEVYVKRREFEAAGLNVSMNMKNGQYQVGSELSNLASIKISVEQYEEMKNHPDFASFITNDFSRSVFPLNTKESENWTVDNYGPIYIPKAGAEVTITPNNINFYSKIIGTYEGNKLEIKRGRVFINDEQVSTYTFKQNYYWAMGDNRHNSEDSRIWGFVPEDHIVGKPLFVWFSLRNGKLFDGIRFNRIFQKGDIR